MSKYISLMCQSNEHAECDAKLCECKCHPSKMKDKSYCEKCGKVTVMLNWYECPYCYMVCTECESQWLAPVGKI